MVTNGHTMASSAPVAYITGGASGMGLAVAEDLSAKGWNLTIVDLNEKSIAAVQAKFDSERTLFVQADVTNYELQGKAFLQTWEKWNRLDLVFANAGIGDRINFYAPAAQSHPNLPGIPAAPDELVIDICLNAMVYSAYLALHFFRRNASKAGKIVFTSSMCGESGHW
jgi:15-hydroxyprostaglandin dehydrogenase (NAD)